MTFRRIPSRRASGPSDTARGSTGARHVALFVPDLEGGGAERMMVTLAGLLAQELDRVDLVLARARGPFLANVPAQVRVIELGPSGVLAALPHLVGYLRRERPDAVISTLRYANVVLVWARALAPIPTKVFLRESTTPSLVEPRPGDLRERVLPLLMRAFYGRADGVVAVSHGVARDLRDFVKVPSEKIHVIYNPALPSDVDTRAAAPLDDPWTSEGHPPLVMSVGRLGPEKDFATLLRAFARVRGRMVARLMILGEGRSRPALEALARSLGIAEDVRLPGFVPDPIPYMARANVYVLSSKREGLPGALIQAMACGCSVVSTDCPSGPREVLADGAYGRLVPVGDDAAMAQAIEAALTRPLDKETVVGRSRVFSSENSLAGYLRLLRGGGATEVDAP